MAHCHEDPLRRTDANEVRFQETVPDEQKYAPTPGQGITSLPKGGQDTGIHVDKPISVTETGYGGVSGRGNDISSIVEESRGQGLDHKGGKSFTDKTKEFAHGVKDLATGKKQHEASVPVVDQSAAHGSHEHKQGLGDKVKDCVTGQRPGHAVKASEGSEEWPVNEKGNPNPPTLLDPIASGPNAETPSATHTDAQGQPIEGPRDDSTKKEGIMSKVMDKFNIGTNKDSAQ